MRRTSKWCDECGRPVSQAPEPTPAQKLRQAARKAQAQVALMIARARVLEAEEAHARAVAECEALGLPTGEEQFGSPAPEPAQNGTPKGWDRV